VSKENLLTVVVALIVGLLGGYLIFNIAGNKELPANVAVPQGAGSPTDYQRRIAEAEKIVAKDPKNAQVWTQLGNDYFDTDQAQKAVNAYSKVLEIEPNNVNVITDEAKAPTLIGVAEPTIQAPM
jgi:cytochrome c-type biogenesis protein CcmH/NrfG